MAWLAHPVTLLSLTTLLVNDHVLKARFPGPVTGKLSDAAGLVLLPPLLSALFALYSKKRTVVAPVLVTGVGFVAVKAIPAVAGLASAGWSAVVGRSVIRADLTDVLVLPALGIALWVGRRARATRPGSARAGAAVTLVLLPLATLAVAATSAPEYPESKELWVRDGRVLAGERNAYHESADADQWRTSDDGGRTWKTVYPHEFDVASMRGSADQLTQSCVPDASDHCYRVVAGHLAVEETTDGGASWNVAWRVSDEQRNRLGRRYSGIDDVARDISSRAVVVVPRTGGHTVVVANGRDGYAFRGVDGTWERIGFGSQQYGNGDVSPDRVVPLEARSLVDAAPEIAVGVAGSLLALAIAAAVAHWPVRRWVGIAIVPVFAAGALIAFGGAIWYRNGPNDRWISFLPIVLGFFLAVATVGTLVVTAVTTRLMDWKRAVLMTLVAVGGAVAVPLIYRGWADDALSYRTAGLSALGVTVVVLVCGSLLTLGSARRPALTGEPG